MLNIRKYALGPVQTNCYIISNNERDCLIIDPGEQGKKIISEVHKAKLNPQAILLTHAHFDHIGAVDIVRDTFNIPVYMHKKEQKWLGDATLNGSAKYAQLPNYEIKPADEFLTPAKEVTVGNFKFQVAYTPGHSPGSISFIFHEDRVAFVGDTLFKSSVGRTDLIGGDTELLLKSIQEQLLVLPKDTIIYPGHDEVTTIADEIQRNPYLRNL